MNWNAETIWLTAAVLLLCMSSGATLAQMGTQRLPVVASDKRFTQPAPHVASLADMAATAISGGRTEELPAPHSEWETLPETPEATFPRLPPDPDRMRYREVPPLGEELLLHGGSYLYTPEGDRWSLFPRAPHAAAPLRLPEDFAEPQPLTAFAEFLGADPIQVHPHKKWLGHGGYYWEPRLVVYGGYSLFGIAFLEGDREQYGLGHQLIVDIDLRLTGTERFHVQYRPVGEENSGGSFYQFNEPSGYIDNSTAVPDRYWFEGELGSIFGAFIDPLAPWDWHVTAGKFPFALHNRLLINDEIQGVALNKNNLLPGNISNVNWQFFYGFGDVDAFEDSGAQLVGSNLFVDYRHAFWEVTYAYLRHENTAARNQHFAAVSRTKVYGPLTIAARGLFKFGDEAGAGDGQLIVLETNFTRYFPRNAFGIESAVAYLNAFGATRGWNSISGGNFDRLRSAFEVNPLVTISSGRPQVETWGAVLGVQLFRHRQDESIIPEVAFESQAGEPVWGLGLRYLRKTGPQTFLQVLGVWNVSDDPQLERRGVFVEKGALF